MTNTFYLIMAVSCAVVLRGEKYTVPETTTLTYLLGDHLGSTSLAVDADTGDVIETRYKPWGEVRYTTPSETLPTRYTFTGQYSHISDDATDLGAAGFGLMFYNARWYDPALGRFAQADSIVPGGIQGLDRFAYVGNNPVRNIDPSGHKCVGDPGECEGIHGYGNDPWPPPSEMGPYVTELYNDYVDLRETLGWWNGNQFGNFTIWDFINLLLSMEFGYEGRKIPPDVLKQLVVRNFYRLCGIFCDPTNPYDVLRWLALRNIKFDRGLSPQDMKANEDNAKDWNTTNFASAFLHHDSLWETDCGDGDVPCEWANKNVDATAIGSPYTQQQLLDRISSALTITPSGTEPPSTEINSFYLQAGGGSTLFIATEDQFNCIYYGIGYQCTQ